MIYGKNKRIILEPHEEQFIRDNFFNKTNQELADALGLKITKFRYFAYGLGLKRIEIQHWTRSQVTFLKQNYKDIGDSELADIFNIKWHKKGGWCKKHIEKKRRYLKLKRTTKQLVAIKERNRLMGCWKDQPEKANILEIGTKRIRNSGGYIHVAIKTKKGFVHYNAWLWEQHHGKVPKGKVVRNFSNRLLDVKITDLKLITRAENGSLNSVHRLPKQLAEIKKLIKQLNTQIKQHN